MNGKVQFRGKEIVKNSESEFLNNGSELRISVWVGFFDIKANTYDMSMTEIDIFLVKY